MLALARNKRQLWRREVTNRLLFQRRAALPEAARRSLLELPPAQPLPFHNSGNSGGALMRPKKKILLVGASEDRLSILKFMLSTNRFAVSSAATTAEALAQIGERSFELLLCMLPLAGVEELLIQAHALDSSIHSLVIGEVSAEIAAVLLADVIYQNRPRGQRPSHTELLERVKVLTARKRGPRSVRKPIQSATVILSADAGQGHWQQAGVA
jgi:two-component system response regulator CpxR